MWDRLGEVGALYPGVGWEIPLALLAGAAWIGWTIWQIRHENAEYAQQVRLLHDLGGAASDLGKEDDT
jgi:hypothetical protein